MQMVQDRVGKIPKLEVNPDEAVAIGAAIHAAELASKINKTLLLDGVGSTLSVGIAGGLVKPLIKKNSPLPVATTEIFHTTRAGQTVARLPVYQGEGTRSSENSKLGELKLEGLFKSVRAEIEVRFELSANGTLSVSAKDLNTGVKETARIEAGAGLRDDERARLQKQEERQKDLLAPADVTERHRNRHARRALHEVLVPLRRIHRELKIAAEETDDGVARQTAESLGQQLVEAESVETTGNREQVVALATHMRDLLVKLVQAQQET
jgi:molecular chaperone DnaK